MADKIGLVDEEYVEFQHRLITMHREYIKSLDSIKMKIRGVNTVEGGLYAEHVSANINSLVSAIDRIETSINALFDTEEEVISTFLKSMDDYDTCC
ncbi:MAG: hypothetical protein IJ053_00580 [Lachnospiraceae bacterium]|nr:hypothetical protein [Lachnospiraceae bacterium]